jgi:hypothetical protein
LRPTVTNHFASLVLCAAACGGARNAPTVDAFTFDDSLYLTVENVGGHCSVTIDELEPSTAAEATVADFAPGQTISRTVTDHSRRDFTSFLRRSANAARTSHAPLFGLLVAQPPPPALMAAASV